MKTKLVYLMLSLLILLFSGCKSASPASTTTQAVVGIDTVATYVQGTVSALELSPAPSLVIETPQPTAKMISTPTNSPTPAEALLVTATATQAASTETSSNPTAASPAATTTGQPAVTPSPAPTETAAAASTSATSPEAGCIDKASFYSDISYPDGTLLKQGEAFIKTWQIRNEGTCVWDKYQLVFASGDNMSGPLATSMPKIMPGETTNVSVNLVSPSRGGEHVGDWWFQNATGKNFGVGSGGGDYIWVKIVVDWPLPAQGSPTSGTPTPAAATCSVEQNQDYISQVLNLINQARTSQGLGTLQLQSQLSAAAFGHSEDMACNDFVDHSGSDGSLWYDRIKAQGYIYSYASENIYVGDPQFGGTPDGAFQWWMNSPVHRDNILNPHINSIGIGYAYYKNSSFGGYYTLDFSRP